MTAPCASFVAGADVAAVVVVGAVAGDAVVEAGGVDVPELAEGSLLGEAVPVADGVEDAGDVEAVDEVEAVDGEVIPIADASCGEIVETALDTPV
ncbi:hypothetical protein NPA31_004835 [Aurantimonas sp. MSK8Z-1]|uniref:hypothetical protein n=1 Tax=Mangrovibrevibacter kandeliae TaxID=2968473 RepID=UPI0021196118|nr:hypothetical protein [Aurantimonas sp. MSK8Z-1]MCW4114289.1 hypothetical protein [Aurantimonas sp. MSK8Z-1]